MPKKVGFLYEKMCDKELIRAAIITGTKGKRHRKDVKIVLADIDGYVEKAYRMLVAGTYTPTVPRSRAIIDKSSGKQRIIRRYRFYFQRIQTRRIDLSAIQGIRKRLLVYQTAATVVQQNNAVFHLCDRVCVYHIRVFIRQRTMQTDDVGAC